VSYPDITPVAPFADVADLGPRSRRLRVFSSPRYYRAGERWGLTVEAFTRAEAPWVARAAEGVHSLAVRDDGLCVCEHLGHRLTFRLRGFVALDASGARSDLSDLSDLSDRAAWRLDLSAMDRGIVAWDHGTGARYAVRYAADGVHDRFVLSDAFRAAVRAKLPAGAGRFGLAFDCEMPPGLARRVRGVDEVDHDTESPIELSAPGIRQRLVPAFLHAPTLSPSDSLTSSGWRERWLFADGRLLQTVPLDALDAVSELRTSVTYQQGTSGYSGCTDAKISHAYLTKNAGGSEFLVTGRWDSNDMERSVIRFDVSGIPAGATINSASLQLRCHGIWYNASTVSAYRVLKDWGEGDNDYTDADAGECCWSYAKYSTAAWSGCANDGTDAETAAQSSVSVNAQDTWYSWGVASAVAAWVGGAANYGLMLRNPESGDQTKAGYRSRNYAADTTLRPKLTVDYTAAPAGGPFPHFTRRHLHGGFPRMGPC